MSSFTDATMNTLPALPDDLASLRYEDFVAIGRAVESSRNFLLGDLACGVEARYGDAKLQEYARDIGVEYRTLLNFRTVARAYPELSRRRELSFGTHQALASQPDRLDLIRSGDYPTVAKARELVVRRNQGSDSPVAPGEPSRDSVTPFPRESHQPDNSSSQNGSTGLIGDSDVIQGEIVPFGALDDSMPSSFQPEDSNPSVADCRAWWARCNSILAHILETDATPVDIPQTKFFMKLVQEASMKGWFSNVQ